MRGFSLICLWWTATFVGPPVVAGQERTPLEALSVDSDANGVPARVGDTVRVLGLVMGIMIPAAREIGVLLTVWIFILSLIDLAVSPKLSRINVQREVGDVMSVGARNAVRLVFQNTRSKC